MRKILLILALVVGMAGCVAATPVNRPVRIMPTEAEAQFGPIPENYQDLVSGYIRGALIDPESARFDFESKPSPQSNGWYGLVWVNAKNRMGGYTGKQEHEYLIKHGEIIHSRRTFREKYP
jgi:hypothetical protein